MDFREYLEKLKKHGQLVDINREVEVDFELSNVFNAMLQENKPVGFFNNVKHKSGIPIVGGLLGNMERIALALDVEVPEISNKLEEALNNLIEPEIVDDAPFKENVILGDDINLLDQLPIPWHNKGDAGPFITSGVMISKDPISGRQNYGYNRLQVKGPKKTGIMMNAWRHINYFYQEVEKNDLPLPFSLAIGVDPAVEIAAGFRIDGDEAYLAGGINGEALKVCKCSTNELYAPACSEIVIEGFILPNVRELEGPLAEFTGHFGEEYQHQVVEITAINYRNKPIYRDLIPGGYEHIYLGNVLPREISLFQNTRKASPNVQAVHLTPYSGGFMAVVSVDKKNDGEPKNIALAAFSTHVNIKVVIVVDKDVNIHQPSDLLWSMATRVDAERDIIIIPYAQGMENDPMTDAEGIHTKYAIDATLPLRLTKDYQRVTYPSVDLTKWYNS